MSVNPYDSFEVPETASERNEPMGSRTKFWFRRDDKDRRYRMPFFVHGLRHRSEAAQALVERLAPGEALELRPDPENPADAEALAVFARGTHVGFAPRYLHRDFRALDLANTGPGAVAVTRVNLAPTPMQFRVLAAYEAPWPEGFRPFAGPEFEPLRPDLAAVA